MTTRDPQPSVDLLGRSRLKDLDPAGLVLCIVERADTLPGGAAVVLPALRAATFLHRHQTRANRAGFPRTAYIEHPLRNALRLISSTRCATRCA